MEANGTSGVEAERDALRAQVERLQAVAVAALAYMESTNRCAGDDYYTTERRRPRMVLDDSVAALQPGDLPGEVKEGL